MVLRRTPLSLWPLACCLLAVAACAPSGPAARPSAEAPYDTVEAERTLASGYATIVERALDPVSAANVAVDAMGGLSGLDATVVVSRLDHRVQLAASGRPVADYPAPADDDVKAWAHLTLTVAIDARAVSSAIKAADGDAVVTALFTATLARLDPFSHYASPKEARDRRAKRDGFGGIGLGFKPAEGGARVVEVMDDTPAKDAGLEAGDLIVRIEGETLSGLDSEAVSQRLRGPVDSEVAITVRRADGHERELTLRRALIVPGTVTTRLRDGIAEFKITSFNQRTAQSLTTGMVEARATLGDALNGVVLDLRGNPGGLLDQAVRMADLFIADGAIVTTRGRHPQASQSYQAQAGDLGEDLPVVVLIDAKSASAAEILAGALQDAGRAVVVGTNSYGKGTVQTVAHLPNDGEMTLTWSRFYTPSGYALHGLGVLPTICAADERAVAAALIAGITDAKASARIGPEMAEWRGVGLDETERRRRLRAICPAARQADLALDLELAEKLLADRAAYGRALALAAPVQPSTAAVPVAPGAASR